LGAFLKATDIKLARLNFCFFIIFYHFFSRTLKMNRFSSIPRIKSYIITIWQILFSYNILKRESCKGMYNYISHLIFILRPMRLNMNIIYIAASYVELSIICPRFPILRISRNKICAHRCIIVNPNSIIIKFIYIPIYFRNFIKIS